MSIECLALQTQHPTQRPWHTFIPWTHQSNDHLQAQKSDVYRSPPSRRYPTSYDIWEPWQNLSLCIYWSNDSQALRRTSNSKQCVQSAVQPETYNILQLIRTVITVSSVFIDQHYLSWYILVLCIYHINDSQAHTSLKRVCVERQSWRCNTLHKNRGTLIFYNHLNTEPSKHTSYLKQCASTATSGDATPTQESWHLYLLWLFKHHISTEPPKHLSDSKQWHVSSGAQFCGSGDAEPPASGGPTDAAQRTIGGGGGGGMVNNGHDLDPIKYEMET